MTSNWKSSIETVRLVFELPQSSNRVNAALFLTMFVLVVVLVVEF